MKANYEIVEATSEKLVIRDVGPWDKYKTITNDVEGVVEELYAFLHLWPGRKLLYYDSADNLDEICHEDGHFTNFKPV